MRSISLPCRNRVEYSKTSNRCMSPVFSSTGTSERESMSATDPATRRTIPSVPYVGVQGSETGPSVDRSTPALEPVPTAAMSGSRRNEWPLPSNRELRRRVLQERSVFDRVAAQRIRWLQPGPPPPSDPAAWLDLRRTPNDRLGNLLASPPSPIWRSLCGCRVLELGGSGETTAGFLAAGAARVDQLDASPGMLDLAQARLTAEQRERVVQHVAAAEALPFDDGTFDVVFSRHCLHHMQRAQVFPEVARVLKTTGWFLFIEPYLPTWLRRAVSFRRLVRGLDRGTDDPLNPADLVLAQRAFRRVDIAASPNAAVLFRSLPPIARTVATLQRNRPLPPSLIHAVGGRVMVLLRDPRRSEKLDA